MFTNRVGRARSLSMDFMDIAAVHSAVRGLAVSMERPSNG